MELPKPLDIIVITDGVFSDDFEFVIIRVLKGFVLIMKCDRGSRFSCKTQSQ
jgi:hypothetical protein